MLNYMKRKTKKRVFFVFVCVCLCRNIQLTSFTDCRFWELWNSTHTITIVVTSCRHTVGSPSYFSHSFDSSRFDLIPVQSHYRCCCICSIIKGETHSDREERSPTLTTGICPSKSVTPRLLLLGARA